MSSAEQTHTDVDVTESGHLLVNVTDSSKQPDGISLPAASNEAPTIPPRPFRPPRPFPPGKVGKLPSGRTKGTRKKHINEPNVQSEMRNHKQLQGSKHEPSLVSVESSPDLLINTALAVNSDVQVQERQPHVAEDLGATLSRQQDVSQPIENTEQPRSESVSAQEQLSNIEEATAVQPQPSLPASSVANLDEVDDQVRFQLRQCYVQYNNNIIITIPVYCTKLDLSTA